MARTIKELAELCKVSEQALRKWCVRNQVAKDVSQHYIIDETTEKAILQHYGVNIEKQVSQPEKPSFATNETTNKLIAMLEKELEAKNKQIENLQKLLDQEQQLNALNQEKIKQLEQKPEEQIKEKIELVEVPMQQGSSVYDELSEEDKKEAEAEAKAFFKPIRDILERLRREQNGNKS